MAEISTFKQNMSNDASQNHPITQPMRHRKEGSSQEKIFSDFFKFATIEIIITVIFSFAMNPWKESGFETKKSSNWNFGRSKN